MRTQLMTWALAAAIMVPAALPAQNTTGVLIHNSAEAAARLLANRQALQLSTAQVERLNQLEMKLTLEQTRLVRVGRLGAPGKAQVPRFERVRVAPRPDHYVETRMISRVLAFSRVPGKAVPRLARIPVVQLVQRPCPFTFLAGTQLQQAHELLTRL